jgi:hypothetical protein
MKQIYLFDKSCDIRKPCIIFNSSIKFTIDWWQAAIYKGHRYITSVDISDKRRSFEDNLAFIGEHKKQFEKSVINALLEVDKEVLSILLAKRPLGILI